LIGISIFAKIRFLNPDFAIEFATVVLMLGFIGSMISANVVNSIA